MDRLVLVWLYRVFPSLLDAIMIIKPETLAALASSWLSSLLALEVLAARRQAPRSIASSGR